MSQRPRKGVHLGAGDGGRKDQKRPLRSKEARPFFIVGGDGIRGGASVLPPFPLAPPQYGGNKGLSGPQASVKLGEGFKSEGNELFKAGNYPEALLKYNQAMKIFQTCAAFLSTDNEMVVTYSNISATHWKLGHYDQAVDSASRCIDMDGNFAKGFFRRAEAYKMLAQGAREKGLDSRSRKDLYLKAVKDYSKCYRKMTGLKEIGMRLKMYYEGMVIAVEQSCTGLLPEVYDCDKGTICGRLLNNIVQSLPNYSADRCLNFLLFVTPRVAKSGLAVALPIDASSITVSQLMDKNLLTPSVLAILGEKGGMPVTHEDISQAVSTLPDKQVDLFKELMKQLKRTGGRATDYRSLLNTAVKLSKCEIAQHLITRGGVPSSDDILKVTEFPSPALDLLKTMAKSATPASRAKLAMRGFMVNRSDLVTIAFSSGSVDGSEMDLCVIMNSYVLDSNINYIKTILRAGGKPGRSEDHSSTPIFSAIHSTVLNPTQQVDVVCMLIEGGASISHLCTIYPEEKMSPVHAATKLLISTNIPRVLEMTCSRYGFPANGRVVNRSGQTPYHLLMAAKLTDATVKGCHILLKYGIDIDLRDDNGKKAEAYAVGQSDPRLVFLRKVKKGSAILHTTRKKFNLEELRNGCDHATAMDYVSRARDLVSDGCDYFKIEDYQNTIRCLKEADKIFEAVVETHHYMRLNITDEWKTLYHHLSMTYLECHSHEAAIRIAYSLIELDREYYQGYLCRANAFLEMAPLRKGQESTERYHHAAQDFGICYQKMAAKEMTDKRFMCFAKVFILSIDYQCYSHIPDVFEQDKPVICTFIVSYLLNLPSDKPIANSSTIVPYLKFLLISIPSIPKSGLAVQLPCSTSKVSIYALFPELTEALLHGLLRNGTVVKHQDIDQAIVKLKTTQCSFLQVMIDNYLQHNNTPLDMRILCRVALLHEKTNFVALLISYGAKPDPKEILDKISRKNMDPKLADYIAQGKSVPDRTILLKDALSSTNIEMAEAALDAGPIDPASVDLSECITSPALVRNPDLLKKLLRCKVVPGGSKNNTLSLVLKDKMITREQQAEVVRLLLEWGAEVQQVCEAYEEQMTPIHAATKLALETGNPDLLEAACSRYKFPASGRLVDKHDQTPFHLALKAKHKDSSVQICSILCRYNIDPQIRDRWNKRADEYGRAKGDKRVPYLFSRPEEVTKKEEAEIKEEGETVSKSKKKRKKKKAKARAEATDEQQVDDEAASEEKLDMAATPEDSAEQLNLPSLLEAIFEKNENYFQSSASLRIHSHTNSNLDSIDSELLAVCKEDLISAKEQKECLKDQDGVLAIKGNEFDDLPWEVECTERVLKFLKDRQCPRLIQDAAVRKIHQLALGIWPHPLQTLSRQLKLYELQLTKSIRIVWEVAVQYSSLYTHVGKNSDQTVHVYSEVVRVWDIVFNPSLLDYCIANIEKSHDRGLRANVQLQLLPQDQKQSAPESEHHPRRFILQDENTAANAMFLKFVPAASIKDDEFNIITFYSITPSMINSILSGVEPRRDFPIKEWPKEHEIINMPTNKEAIVLLGRSGTGKTTCCLYRLWNIFHTYWDRAVDIGPWYRHNPLLVSRPIGEEEHQLDPQDEDDSKGVEHLHQVFISKNHVLCAQMKKKFYDLVAGYPKLAEHSSYESVPSPSKLDRVVDHSYPLFLTSRQFLLLLDCSLDVGKSFFPYKEDGTLAVKILSSDYDSDDPDFTFDLADIDSDVDDEEEIGDDTAAQINGENHSMSSWREVTASYFVENIWPRIRYHCADKNIDPLLVWMEIKSFIKGSAQAVESKDGYLSQEEYEALGRKMAANFVGNREEVYHLFIHYQDYLRRERHQNLFDECELVHNLYQRLLCMPADPRWSIHHFYIDEVQDFMQAELSVYLKCCRDPNNLFLTGDTAQSIMRGISFRFGDLRSLFHYAGEKASLAKPPIKIAVPKVHNLTVNFRSHAGILHLAASIINLLKEYFPSSFDCLPDDKGMFPGPKPVLLHSCQVSDLALLLQGNKREASSIEFGAHQVIIVQTNEAKKRIPEALKAGIVLTVFEAKGLEFDDVLLYDFFKDSPVDKEWRVVTSYSDKHPVTLSRPVDLLESQPRPLEFDERLHKSLNSELKYLYTAITRAKCNLWLYDASESKRLPIFDYWVRRGLVRVVKMGEKEEDDKVLFTATSTPEQWQLQGDYFKRKGLWEPAMKCYHKAGATLQEKEAEAHLFVQKGKKAQSIHEKQMLFEKAAEALLLCDYREHDVKYLSNAATCLKIAKKYSEAAKLYDKLGKRDHAMRCFMKGKDHANIAKLKEEESDYSSAVRTYAESNKRIEALELANKYTHQGHKLDADVSLLQLASQYAKYYAHRRDELNLRKVIVHIADPLMKGAYLKQAELYEEAVDIYYKADLIPEADHLASAQELYDTAITWAKKGGRKTRATMLVLEQCTALICNKHQIDDELKTTLQRLTRNSNLSVKALSSLLFGRAFNSVDMCQQALVLYRSVGGNTVGQLEAFNQIVRLNNDVECQQIVIHCVLANDLASSFRSSQKSASFVKSLHLAQEFYHLERGEEVYLTPRAQNIWLPGAIRAASCREKLLDDDGMMRLLPDKVHKLLAEHFGSIWKGWLVKTELDRKIQQQLDKCPFHGDLLRNGYLVHSNHGYSADQLKVYLEILELDLQTRQLVNPKELENRFNELQVKLMSSRVIVSIPYAKQHKVLLGKSKVFCSQLKIFYDRVFKNLKKASFDDVYCCWRIDCLVKGQAEDMEIDLQEFAEKHGSNKPEESGFTLVRGKWVGNEPIHNHYFWFWLRACSIINKEHVVLPAIKCVHYFLQIVARRRKLRESMSVANFVDIVGLCTSGLVGLINLAYPDQNLLLPALYQHTVQVFDLFNSAGPKNTWFLSTCLEQVNRKFRMNHISKMRAEVVEYLFKYLDLLVGRTHEWCHILREALDPASGCIPDGSAMHCLVLCLTLVANLLVIKMDHFKHQLSTVLADICHHLHIMICGMDSPTSVPQHLLDAYNELTCANSVADLFEVIQHLMAAFGYSNKFCQAVSNKNSWGVELIEVSFPSSALSKLKFEALSSFAKILPQHPNSDHKPGQSSPKPPSKSAASPQPPRKSSVASPRPQHKLVEPPPAKLPPNHLPVQSQPSQPSFVPAVSPSVPAISPSVPAVSPVFSSQPLSVQTVPSQQPHHEQPAPSQAPPPPMPPVAPHTNIQPVYSAQPPPSSIPAFPAHPMHLQPANPQFSYHQQQQGLQGNPYHFPNAFGHPISRQADPFSMSYIDPTSLPPGYTPDGIPQEWEDELAGIEFDEEVEHMVTPQPAGPATSAADRNQRFKSKDSSMLIDEHYCSVCGVSLDTADGEPRPKGRMRTFREHILLPSHQQNLQSFKLFQQAKSMTYDHLVDSVNIALSEATQVDSVSVETMITQCKSDLHFSEQQLAELSKRQLWKDAFRHVDTFSQMLRLHLEQIQAESARERRGQSEVSIQRRRATNLKDEDMWVDDDDDDYFDNIDPKNKREKEQQRKKGN